MTPLASTSSPTSIEASPASIRSSVVLPAPLRPDSVIRSRRSSLKEIAAQQRLAGHVLAQVRCDHHGHSRAMVGAPATPPRSPSTMTRSCSYLRGPRSRRSRCRPARTLRVPGPRRAVPPRHRRRRSRGDAPARLDGQRRPELVRGLRRPDRRRLPRARDRPPRPRPRPAPAGPVPPRRLRRRRRGGPAAARARARRCRRILDGRRDRPADRPRPPRRRLGDRAQRYRPALAGSRDPPHLARDGGPRAARCRSRPGSSGAGASAARDARERAHGLGPVRADAPLRARHGRGRPRARHGSTRGRG